MTGQADANYAARLDLEENSLTRVKNVHIFNNDEIRQERKLFFKNAPFTARSHVSYWRQRFAVTNACGIANFINRAAQHIVLKNTL